MFFLLCPAIVIVSMLSVWRFDLVGSGADDCYPIAHNVIAHAMFGHFKVLSFEPIMAKIQPAVINPFVPTRLFKVILFKSGHVSEYNNIFLLHSRR
jgi:hypothetical protein